MVALSGHIRFLDGVSGLRVRPAELLSNIRLKVPLGRRAMRAGQSREQRLGETGNGTTVDLVHHLRLGRVWRGGPALIADAQHRAL
jgi:hypothetical protein